MEPQKLTVEQVKVFTLSPAVVRLIAEIKTARVEEARIKAAEREPAAAGQVRRRGEAGLR